MENTESIVDKMKKESSNEVYINRTNTNIFYSSAAFFTVVVALMVVWSITSGNAPDDLSFGFFILGILPAFCCWCSGFLCGRYENSHEFFLLSSIGIACEYHRITLRYLKWSEIVKLSICRKNGFIKEMEFDGVRDEKRVRVYYHSSYRGRPLLSEMFDSFFSDYKQWEITQAKGYYTESYHK